MLRLRKDSQANYEELLRFILQVIRIIHSVGDVKKEGGKKNNALMCLLFLVLLSLCLPYIKK